MSSTLGSIVFLLLAVSFFITGKSNDNVFLIIAASLMLIISAINFIKR